MSAVAVNVEEIRELLLPPIRRFPVPHWKAIWNTNPLERLNKEIKRPHRRRRRLSNPAALLCLAGSPLVAAHDQSQVADSP
jgi:putative transposase